MTSKIKIMIVDDDETIVETLTYNLTRNNFTVYSFNNGALALQKFTEVIPDLVILDWMLPDMKGPDICALLREQNADLPVLMLTGRSTPQDIAFGLSKGADDYLVKPFSMVELLARLEALIRRSLKDKARSHKGRIELGSLILDEDARRVSFNGKNIELSPREFSLLKVLMQNVGRALSTEALLDRVWGSDFDGDVKTVAVHVRWLRQKLEADPKNPTLLETVHRSGYRLNMPEAVAKEN
ncbi:MAG: response regulator transcription factor [Cyanobacteria bacterium SZAS LIN-2]|nr:response regulator transcription factor [Cyanobacteria bacterium SZAS LIN-3]MBS1995693.1 response regulator transcription factor [Cyanobacteria bacterium SZAS LIN-2]